MVVDFCLQDLNSGRLFVFLSFGLCASRCLCLRCFRKNFVAGPTTTHHSHPRTAAASSPRHP